MSRLAVTLLDWRPFSNPVNLEGPPCSWFPVEYPASYCLAPFNFQLSFSYSSGRESIDLKQFELTLRKHIIWGWRELDDWHHMRLTIPAELWGLITHIFGVPLGIVPGWWDDRKRNHKFVLPLHTFTCAFPTISAVHFLAFAYLAIIFWSKKCVMTGIEGLMSSGYVTNVTGTLFRMTDTSCWTVRMNIISCHTAPPVGLPTPVWG